MFKFLSLLKNRMSRRKTAAVKIAELEKNCKEAAKEQRAACQISVRSAAGLQGAIQENKQRQGETVDQLRTVLTHDSDSKIPSLRKTKELRTLDIQGQGA